MTCVDTIDNGQKIRIGSVYKRFYLVFYNYVAYEEEGELATVTGRRSSSRLAILMLFVVSNHVEC
jgi:hypothetical protein